MTKQTAEEFLKDHFLQLFNGCYSDSEEVTDEVAELIQEYAQSHTNEVLDKLKERVDDMYGDAMAPPQSAESGYNHAIEKVLAIIQDLKQ